MYRIVFAVFNDDKGFFFFRLNGLRREGEKITRPATFPESCVCIYKYTLYTRIVYSLMSSFTSSRKPFDVFRTLHAQRVSTFFILFSLPTHPPPRSSALLTRRCRLWILTLATTSFRLSLVICFVEYLYLPLCPPRRPHDTG